MKNTQDDLWAQLETGKVEAVYATTANANEFLQNRRNAKRPHFHADGEERPVTKVLDGYPFAGWHIKSSSEVGLSKLDSYDWKMPDGTNLPDIFFECGRNHAKINDK